MGPIDYCGFIAARLSGRNYCGPIQQNEEIRAIRANGGFSPGTSRQYQRALR